MEAVPDLEGSRKRTAHPRVGGKPGKLAEILCYRAIGRTGAQPRRAKIPGWRPGAGLKVLDG